MKKLGLCFLSLFLIILLSACGKDYYSTDSSIVTFTYEDENYYITSSKYDDDYDMLSVKRDGKFEDILDLNGCHYYGDIPNLGFLFSCYDLDNRLYIFKTINLETLEWTALDLGTYTSISFYPKNYSDDYILFTSLDGGHYVYVVYDTVIKQVIHEYEIQKPEHHSGKVNAFFDGRFIFIEFQYSTYETTDIDIRVDTLYDRIETFQSDHYRNHMEINGYSYTFFETNSRMTAVDIRVVTPIYSNRFHDMYYYNTVKLESNIVEFAYDYKSITVYDQDLNYQGMYNIDIDCKYKKAINDHEIKCTQIEQRGAFIRTTYRKTLVFDFVTQEIVIESRWEKSSDQLNYIKREKS
ncbi:MAG: hypothetical protein ABII85_01250 [Bacillota bacterium]